MSAAPLRCALYMRLACDHSDDHAYDRLEVSRAFQHGCQRRFGEAIHIAIYHDTASSGEHMERPALQRLMRDVQLKEVDLVITPDSAQLSCNADDHATLTRFFASHQVKFIDCSTNAMRPS